MFSQKKRTTGWLTLKRSVPGGGILLLIILLCAEWVHSLKSTQGKITATATQHSAHEALFQPPSRSAGNFRRAKELAYSVYGNEGFTFYCGCPFRGKQVFHKQCDYTPDPTQERAYRTEWEHIVPASDFGRHFKAWTSGHPDCRTSSGRPFRGRRCAGLVSEAFRKMEADLYNLVPAIGEVNRRRGNLKMIPGDQQMADGKICSLTFLKHGAVPDEKIRGFIARTYLYMQAVYPEAVHLTQAQQNSYQKWHQDFPPTPEEIRRAEKIREIQGNQNHYVSGMPRLQNKEMTQSARK